MASVSMLTCMKINESMDDSTYMEVYLFFQFSYEILVEWQPYVDFR